MRSAAVSKLKASLSEYLASVKRGEEVLITERGKPIARLAPVSSDALPDARRQDLIRQGVLKPGKGRISDETLRGLPIVALPADTVAQMVDTEREDRI